VTRSGSNVGLSSLLAEPATRLIGTFLLIPRVEIVELAALSGFDLVVLDWEHGPYGSESTMPLVVAAQQRGMFALVRVRADALDLIGTALDIGADGVIVPHVDSQARARQAVAAARFPPEGERSLNPWVRGAHYSGSSAYLADASRQTACVVTIEGESGVREASAIISTPGIDAIFIGPVDLAASLGVPGRVDHPQVMETIDRLISEAARSSVGVSIFAPTPELAHRWLTRGARLVLLAVDTSLALSGFRHAIDELRSPETHRDARDASSND